MTERTNCAGPSLGVDASSSPAANERGSMIRMVIGD